ncbi:MAG: FG-GAP-like repeat-containing protein [Pirellulaceae bacterium]|nr:FG-GAP-like repeat-containing protein [Pirellulaceae bacterium]
MRCYYTKRLLCVVLVVSIFVVLTGYSANAQEAPANPFATIIRAADPLTPAEQLTKFQLPTGFKIELVTSEPHIPKPINMAFDARGRLWVAGSIEYPYAAAAGKGRDTISVLEDTTGDGRYDKLTKFAEGLNIPIGLYPYKNGAVVYSIPNILFLQDTNGDGKADKREVLYGPLGTPRDVHGLQNGFTRGFDGWLYICHGYNNDSTITGADGSRIQLNSGNTYRVRLDGSRVEQFTWGQVNPFGMAFTAEGDIFNVDCHSKPLSMLMRNGYYPSFGKPHDGLGYVQSVMEHGHGSTAISGVGYYTGHQFPPEYRNNIFVGNVMTSRINRDSFKWQGSTAKAQEMADFLQCSDSWFRPVDIQIGPDGALYIADFYNRIIGHYEVALDHPGRDRTSGRIWRVTYTGAPGKVPMGTIQKPVDLSSATTEVLIKTLADSDLTRRMLATDQLSDRVGLVSVPELLVALRNRNSATTRVHALWVMHRLGKTTSAQLIAAAGDQVALVRNHALRVISETPNWSITLIQAVVGGLQDENPLVRRSAAGAIAQHPDLITVRPLLDALHSIPVTDAHLRHACRIALRNQLRVNEIFVHLQQSTLSVDDRHIIASVSLGLKSSLAAEFLLGYLEQDQDKNRITAAASHDYLSHAAKYLRIEQIERVVQVAQACVPDDLDLQLTLLLSVQQSLQQRGQPKTQAIQQWGKVLAERLLVSFDSNVAVWANSGASNPWGLQPRNSADGVQGVMYLSSLLGGEDKTGRLRSKTFAVPEQLQFYICGHRGFPKDDASEANYVQLRLAETNEVVRKVFPPRSDLGARVDWDLSEFKGQRAYVEIVDGMTINAYAWLAVARFSPPVVSVPSVAPAQIAVRLKSAAELVGNLQLKNLKPALERLVLADNVGWSVRRSAAESLNQFGNSQILVALSTLIDEGVVATRLRAEISGLWNSDNSEQVEQQSKAILSKVMRTVPTRLQRQLAELLASTAAGGEVLLELVENGKASARLLQNELLVRTLVATKLESAAERVEVLTQRLPPLNDQIKELITQRTTGYVSAVPVLARGEELFNQKCIACHQILGRGAVVGPQLDGIGNRGLERIIEDLLDPSRNVDVAFQTSIYILDSGQIITGLHRRKEGKTLVVVNQKGEEIRIQEDEIDEQMKSKISIMPENIVSEMPPQDFYDLAAFLNSQRKAEPSNVKWATERIDGRFRSEGVAVADVNRDGKEDILVGELWYEAPNWTPHEIAPVIDNGDGAHGYSANFACFVDDLNHDQWPDLIVIGFPGTPCHWYENPQGTAGHWKKHEIWHSACNETVVYEDLFGSGQRVLVMGWEPAGRMNEGTMAWFSPGDDPTEKWMMHPISRSGRAGQPAPATNRFSHGLGVGDINSDDRADVICANGWWQQPAEVDDKPWTFHAANLGPACANMVTADVNGDGAADILSSSAHQFGIWWHQQVVDDGEEDAEINFIRHDLFPDLVSQTHALHFRDINGDGLQDIITGKRFWAHGPKGDPGSDQLAVVYWFEAKKDVSGLTTYIPRIIHQQSGVGTQFWVGDINGDGLLDVVTSNKSGVHVSWQSRTAK